MKKIIAKNYIYEGLGFPIELRDVEMVKIDGELHPKIDVRKIADLAIKSLVLQNKRLTGNQIKFIRTYYSMSLREFSKIVNESHMAIKKWEDYKDKPTNMDKNIEIMIRLQIYNRIISDKKSDKRGKMNFYKHFLTLVNMFSHMSAKNMGGSHLQTA